MKHILTKAKEVEEFNNNPFLLGFTNGVYDLENDEFRNYTYEDYVTLSVRYDYTKPKDNEETINKKKTLQNIIESIHPDPETRLLYLQVLASGLDGVNKQKLFLFNGMGGNGKGLTGGLMDNTLGDYYHQPNNGILKDCEKANVPSPDIMNFKWKRYINFKEVDGNIKVTILRNLCGGGKFTGRLLHQNPEEFTMNATWCMEFNLPPELDGKPMEADYRRLVDLKFPVNFTDDANKIGKEICGVMYKKGNTYYETQEFFSSYRDVFLDLLLDIYRKHRSTDKTGIAFTVPESIKRATNEFIANQNIFVNVFNDLWESSTVENCNREEVKQKTQNIQNIWFSIEQSEEYRNLNARMKRQYNKKEFYRWIQEKYVITGNTTTGKQVVGIIRKTDHYYDVDGEVITDNDDNSTLDMF